MSGVGGWIFVVAAGLSLPVWGCGSTSSGGPGVSGGSAANTAGQASGGGGTTSGSGPGQAGSNHAGVAGSSAQAGAGGSGGSGVVSSEAAQACRAYFQGICARVAECGAPKLHPCESPADACPDILFSQGSSWTVASLNACTETWKTHDCAALAKDQWPACSTVPGTRERGKSCTFDAQCQSGQCNAGFEQGYEASCGICAETATLDGTCDEQHVCPAPQSCRAGDCVGRAPLGDPKCAGVVCPDDLRCSGGVCLTKLPEGSACIDNQSCQAGLDCQIELVAASAPEPKTGTCKALPAVGAACLPTFGRRGACPDGATCDGRPTGKCVPLGKIGQACSAGKCEAGAYCQIYGYQSLQAHQCYALGKAGDACPHQGADLGFASCAEGLSCLCDTPGCKQGKCRAGGNEGDLCGAGEACGDRFTCVDGKCVNPTTAGNTAAGQPCLRSSQFARESSSCGTGLDCLCTDAACKTPLCATPRNVGEACNGTTQICNQGLLCVEAKCVLGPPRDIDLLACPSAPP